MMKQFKKFSLIAVVALAGTAFTANASPVLQGEFQIQPGVTFSPTFAVTSVNLTTDTVDFTPDTDANIFIVEYKSGHFVSYDAARIYDVTSILTDTTSGPGNRLLDLGNYASIGSTSDGVDTFTLTDALPLEVKQSGNNVAIDFAFAGIFNVQGMTADGAGNLTFQVNNSTADAVQTKLSNGTLTQMSFSGGAFTVEATSNSVPTPASLAAGLGLIAVTGLRRKLRR
jgi:hypothetical protein